MLIKILAVLALLVAALVVVIAFRPDEFRVTRSIVINAPPSAVFPYLNDQQLNEKWGPWSKLDPQMKQSYSGPQSGVGAAVTWDGNNEVGAGTSTIIESRPDELVKVKLDFERPFKGTNTAEFVLKPVDGGTEVSWSMYGKNNFLSKAVGLVMDCDKMCGDMFNQGLASLKTLVESRPAGGM